MQFQATVGQTGDNRIMRDHDDGASLGVHFTKLAEHDFFVHGVEVAGGLVGQNDVRIVDQGPGDADALLFAAGKLRRQMLSAVFESDLVERGQRFGLVRHAVEVLRQHDVLKRREIWDQVKLLEDEADLLRAKAVELRRRHFGNVGAVNPYLAAGRLIKAAHQVHQRRLARAGRAHHGKPFARSNRERDVIERAHFNVALVDARHVLEFNRHYSPRRIPAGCICCNNLNGAVEAISARATLASKTGTRRKGCGRMAASKLALPIQKAMMQPRTYPAADPASASRAASEANRKLTVRLEAPRAFMTAKSLRRSSTEPVNVATMQSMISTTTAAEDARTTERVLPTTAVCACVIWRTGFTSTPGSPALSWETTFWICCGLPSTRSKAVLGRRAVRRWNSSSGR